MNRRNFLLALASLATLPKNVLCQNNLKPKLFPVSIKFKWGFINEHGKVVISPKYTYASNFYDDLASVGIDSGSMRKFQYIDRTGKEISEAKYDGGGDFSEGVAPIIINEKYGYINQTGNIIINPKFDYADIFSEGFGRITYKGVLGYVNRNGIVISDSGFYFIGEFKNGLAPFAIRKNGVLKMGFINPEGRQKIAPKYTFVSSFSDGFAVACKDGKSSIRDGIVEFNSNIPKSSFHFIDIKGDEVFSKRFDSASQFSEGLAGVFLNSKWGYINKSGKVTIKPTFDSISNFSNGLARVRTNHKNYVIDTKGKIQFENKYYFLHDFFDGLASFQIETGNGRFKYGYINTNGEEVWFSDDLF
jgi:WG containing repeat